MIDTNQSNESSATEQLNQTREPRLWRGNGWTARVIKNEDDEGWAVEMIKDGEAEPALVGPWTMGRDKKNPKPLDPSAFNTLVKTAGEFRQRQEQQLHSSRHQSLTINTESGRVSVALEIIGDDDDLHAIVTAINAMDELVARVRVAPGFKLSKANVNAWIASGFQKLA